MGGFISESLAGFSDNSSPDLEGREESGRAMEKATEEAIERTTKGHSQ